MEAVSGSTGRPSSRSSSVLFEMSRMPGGGQSISEESKRQTDERGVRDAGRRRESREEEGGENKTRPREGGGVEYLKIGDL